MSTSPVVGTERQQVIGERRNITRDVVAAHGAMTLRNRLPAPSLDPLACNDARAQPRETDCSVGAETVPEPVVSSEDLDVVMDLYKLAVGQADNISSRRASANSYFLID